jgi:hypothetical protein
MNGFRKISKVLCGACVMVLFLFVCAFSEIMEVTKEGAPVYRSQNPRRFERPSFYLNKKDLVRIIKKAKKTYYIQSKKGYKGWIKKKYLREIGEDEYDEDGLKKTQAFENIPLTTFDMEELEIVGFYDVPQAIYILDFENEMPLLIIDKSFIRDPNFMENIVRAEFELETELFYTGNLP